MAQSQEDSQEPEIWPIPDLADWPDSVLAENLAIYKAEPPDAYMEYRINELEAEIERREAISRRAMQEPSGALQPESGDDTLSVLEELGCPPLTIQFGEVGGLRLDTAPEVGSVLAAISVALEDDGHRELAEHVRKLWTTGIAPILESKKTNG
jgi:hypothetical protein